MKDDWLIYALCLLLICVGGIFGHSLAVSEMGFFDFVIEVNSGWIQFSLGLLVSFVFYKMSGAQAEKQEAATNRILRYQHLRDKGVDVDVDVVKDKEDLILSQNHSFTESIAATGYVDRIIMTRTVEKADP